MNLLKFTVVILALFQFLTGNSQVFMTESFELGGKPAGWTEEAVSGNEPWRYRNGGHSPNDNNWMVPPQATDITRNPPSAYDGTYNAIFFKQGDNNERTKLVTPPLNLLGGSSIELSFFLCQIPWTFEGASGWDVLRVYYKTSETGEWNLLQEYLDPVYDWEQQTLTLPNPSATYYIAFEGQTRWGYGTCIDEISIEERGFQPHWIKEIDFEQPFNDFAPSRTPDLPVMRIGFTVFGNTGDAILNNINFTSLNTTDTDISFNGVKLYSTTSQTFSIDDQLGVPTNFESGIASFTGLNYSLPRGQSYLWLCYDVDQSAKHGNILDVMVASGGILANDTIYPSVDMSPVGERVVYETQYFENFEGVHNWVLSGDFEINTPEGGGGSPGNPDPESAYSGTKSLGNDLTGLGIYPYKYEPGISDASSNLATSPSMDVFYYKDLNLFFQRQLNIEVWDMATIQISTNNGTTWSSLWESNSYLSDFQWTQQHIPIPDIYSRTHQLKIRYKLGPTDGQNNYSGWNIDDIYVTGEFISKDAGVSEWIYPLSGSGHSANDSVTIRISNFGGAEITDPVPVAFSFDGGLTWTIDNMTQNIPVEGSVLFTFPTKTDLSQPGLRSSVLAKTMLPGDQYAGNDQIATQIYIVPTYQPPYIENFDTNEGYWRKTGGNLWQYGTPAGVVINSASSGTKSWATGLTQQYDAILSQKNIIIFQDDFESNMDWTFTGEFERKEPNNMYPPWFAYSGYYCIGTDLSGMGVFPYDYENGITPASAYTAISPAFDVRDYSNLKLSYMSMIAVQNGDSVKFEVSMDNGLNWILLWKNEEGGITDEEFILKEYSLHDSLCNSAALRFRFSLYYSSSSGPVAAGFNIDDFILYGDLVNIQAANLSSPRFDLTGITNPVFETRLWVDTEQGVDGLNLLYSLDDGNNWLPVTGNSVYDSYWNWYTGNHVEALGANGWSGQSNGWVTIRHLLPAPIINNNNVQFRLKFMADKFNNLYDGVAVDDIRIIEAPHNIGVSEILSPQTSCEIGPNQKFTLRLKNYGIRTLPAGESITIGYNINLSGDIQTAEETIQLTQSFPAGATRDFTMTTDFDFSVSGNYQTNVFTIQDDPYFYSAIPVNNHYQLIRVNKPLIELGPDVSTVRPDTVVLKAYSGIGGQTYLWQDGSTDSLFNVTTQGKYYVRVTNDIGCNTSDTMRVTQLIPDLGVSELLSPFSDCEIGSNIPVEIVITNFGTDTIDINDKILITRKINSDLLSDTLIMTERLIPGNSRGYVFSENYDFSSPGVYNMKIFTTYPFDLNYSNDTLNYILEVYGYPPVNLGADTTIESSSHVLNPLPGYNEYLWQDGSTLETFMIDTPGTGHYYVTVSDIHGCTASDSIYLTLNVTDIEPLRIISPETACGLTENINVSVRIRNSGNVIIPSGQLIPVSYFVDEDASVQESFQLSEDFVPGDSVDYAFSQVAQVLPGQWHDFTVYVEYSGDTKSSNDSISIPVGVFESPVVDIGEEFQFIAAFEYTLDAGPGFSSYLWHDGSTEQTLTISQIGINDCWVIVTDENGCPGTDQTQIMLAVPDIGISEIIHPITTCDLGTEENIMVAIKNFGNWEIPASADISVVYSINNGPLITESIILNEAFDNGTVINHTFSSNEDLSNPGNYQIKAYTVYTGDLVPANDTLIVGVDIFDSPVVTIGDGEDSIVIYDPYTLEATPGFTSYLWQDGNTNQSYEVITPGANMHTVHVIDEIGCTASAEVFVTYYMPDLGITRVTSPVNSCTTGQPGTISIEIKNFGTSTIPAGVPITMSYSVNNMDAVIQNVNLPVYLEPNQTVELAFSTEFDFSLPFNYQLLIDIMDPIDPYMTNNTLQTVVSIWGINEVEIGGGKDTIIATLPVTLDAGSGYSTYTWQDNSKNSSLNVSKYGLYWVAVSNMYGCISRDTVLVTSLTSNGNNAFNPRVNIYPNPATEFIHVEANTDMRRIIFLEMYSIDNKLLYRQDFERDETLNTIINLQHYSPGIYFLRITMDNIPYVFKVIVE